MDDASPLPQLIGERVRAERQARQWTLDHLVEASGVSRRMLINIEQGSANPSIGILLKLSDSLGVTLAALVQAPTVDTLAVTPAGSGPVLWSSPTGGRAVLVASTSAPEVVELWDWTLAPGDRHTSQAHVAGTRELLHVLEGTLTIEVAGQAVSLATGDALTFYSDVAHSYANPADVPARFSLSVFEPALGAAPRPRSTRA